MSREKHLQKRRRQELREKGFIPCGYCDEMVSPSALRCEHCGKLYNTGKQLLAVAIALIVALSAVGVYFLYPQEGQGAYVPPEDVPTVLSASPTGSSASVSSVISATFNRDMNQASVESAFSIAPYVPGTFSWSGNTLRYSPSASLAEGTYYAVTIGSGAKDTDGQSLDCGIYIWRFTTAGGSSMPTLRSIGTGDNEFWSTSTSHPTWAQAAVQSKPVLILTHTTGCYPCTVMTGTCEQVYSEYSGYITYYDLTSGEDEPDASQCFAAYDPVPPNYVPLTTLLTLGPSNQIIWHSWEGVIDEATLSSWIDDAISYHNQ